MTSVLATETNARLSAYLRSILLFLRLKIVVVNQAVVEKRLARHIDLMSCIHGSRNRPFQKAST